MSQLALDFAAPARPGDRCAGLVWCWGLIGGWGWRHEQLADTEIRPCSEPACLREQGHDGKHNPRAAGASAHIQHRVTVLVEEDKS